MTLIVRSIRRRHVMPTRISLSGIGRRDLLMASAAMGILALTRSVKGESMEQTTTPAQSGTPERPPAIKPDLVKEFVVAAHGDLDKVKALLAQEPGLLNATWDWGGGDFEAAIGGAGHMGRRDIALFLLEKGARMDIFVAAMLGEIEVVRATLQAFPGLLKSKGPHGILLIAHARAGGKEAQVVLDYLQSLHTD